MEPLSIVTVNASIHNVWQVEGFSVEIENIKNWNIALNDIPVDDFPGQVSVTVISLKKNVTNIIINIINNITLYLFILILNILFQE